MQYCCHVLTSALSLYLNIFVKLDKRVSRSVGSSQYNFLEPLADGRNLVITLIDVYLNWSSFLLWELHSFSNSFSVFFRHYFWMLQGFLRQ